MSLKRLFKIPSLIALMVLALVFQNCSRLQDFSTGQQTTPLQNSNPITGIPQPSNLAGNGNGDGYSGKPDIYEFRDPSQLCSDVGANLKPLPTQQIFSYNNNSIFQIVRRACADITPETIPTDQITVLGNGDVVYQNITYQLNASPGDFDVLAAACPVGRNLIPAALRTNLLQDSQNLLAGIWGGPVITGLTIQPNGSLAGLPAYNIERSDSGALENYRRPAQDPFQAAGTDYVFSFLAKPHATEKVMFISDLMSVQDLEIEFDLVTGAGNVLVSTGVSNVSTSVRSFGGSLFISVYFRNITAGNPHIGLASADQILGSNVDVTAFQLEAVDQFCTP